jgi:FkbM family methyltransferase
MLRERALRYRSKQTIRRVLHELGIDVVPYDGKYFFNRRRIEIINELEVDCVIDVGANIGQFGRELRRDGYRGKIVSFEPLPDAFEVLRSACDPEWTALRCALGRAQNGAAMNVAGNSWSSSLLPVSARHVAVAPDAAPVGTTQVAVLTLDSFDLPGRLYLKADVQGAEFDVLQGAQSTLQRSMAVELELSPSPLYVGQAPMGTLIDELYEQGFGLADIARGFVNKKTREVMQLNAIFARFKEGG